jgi:hypothetical protein
MDPISDAEYEAFLGPKAERYLPFFRQQDQVAGAFRASWNWSAFGFGFLWFLYRKMYLWAALAFVLGLMLHTALLAMVASGVLANYLYHRQARACVERLRLAFPGQDLADRLALLGGVHRWVPWAGAALLALLMVWIVVLGFTFSGH